MTFHREVVVPLPRGELRLGRTAALMGILNVTPDSFSDGGQHASLEAAVAQAQRMIADGATVIDIGGESTRPGAEEVSVQSELDRALPVFDALADCPVPLSIDTYKALVADQAVQAGAQIINDVHGLQREPEIADVAALHGVPVVITHWDTERDRDRDIIAEISRFFDRSLSIAGKAGLAPDRIVLDPGFGFAKSIAENYEILRRLQELQALGPPLLVGTSRKRMIGRVLDDVAADQRDAGTAATSVIAYLSGASFFRVHDVRVNRDALRVAEAAVYGPPEEPMK